MGDHLGRHKDDERGGGNSSGEGIWEGSRDRAGRKWEEGGGSSRTFDEQREDKRAMGSALTGKEDVMPQQSLRLFSAALCIDEQRPAPKQTRQCPDAKRQPV